MPWLKEQVAYSYAATENTCIELSFKILHIGIYKINSEFVIACIFILISQVFDAYMKVDPTNPPILWCVNFLK